MAASVVRCDRTARGYVALPVVGFFLRRDDGCAVAIIRERRTPHRGGINRRAMGSADESRNVQRKTGPRQELSSPRAGATKRRGGEGKLQPTGGVLGSRTRTNVLSVTSAFSIQWRW